MKPISSRHDFWSERQEVNARKAIFHQWQQLEASGCIENFRIAAGDSDGFREGWFFADSDAYKWLEAAIRIQSTHPDDRLTALIEDFIGLLSRTQMPDGYIFTYNQIFFPDIRWQNLQIEHELYCHGHLIEAGVTHYEVSGQTKLLEIATKAADRIVADFSGKGAEFTPGHEEIEIALLRLHQVSKGDTAYLEMAKQFIEQRGRLNRFAVSLFRQNAQVGKRDKIVRHKKIEYLAAHPDFTPFRLPPDNLAKKPPASSLRWYASVLSGKYFQQHAPVRQHLEPVGHAVRFSYLETAVAMLACINSDRTLIPALEQAWEHMVTRRMYITGGIGSVPSLEGFGRDYELDPEYAYAETCAALGCLFWNWEMAQLTGEARYSDLFEWQLYNAVGVGMGLGGTTYLYNNPLLCRGGVRRQPWYAIPCCPSNISRTYANLGKYIVSSQPRELRVHQYISMVECQHRIELKDGNFALVSMQMESDLPWDGHARLKILDISNVTPSEMFDLLLRNPGWCDEMRIGINNGEQVLTGRSGSQKDDTASGFDPRNAIFHRLSHKWAIGDEVEIVFDMPIKLRRAHPLVKGHKNKVAVTRGPLVYCLEDVDNPVVDIFTAQLESQSLEAIYDADILGGVVKLQGKTFDGQELIFIPYYLWGNRGPSRMTVWICS